jgi:hypothetical protein
MAKAPKRKLIEGVIDSRPEIAGNLGRLVGRWGLLESKLISILQLPLGIDQLKATIIFNTFPALGQKIQLIERLLRCYVQDSPERKKLLQFCQRALARNTVRNKFVHAIWGAGLDQESLTLFPQSLPHDTKSRLSQIEQVTAQDIQNEIDKIAELSEEIMVFLFDDSPKLVILQRPLA